MGYCYCNPTYYPNYYIGVILMLSDKQIDTKKKEIDNINEYFLIHKKNHDKRKPRLIKLKKQLTEEIADTLLKKYNI